MIRLGAKKESSRVPWFILSACLFIGLLFVACLGFGIRDSLAGKEVDVAAKLLPFGLMWVLWDIRSRWRR